MNSLKAQQDKTSKSKWDLKVRLAKLVPLLHFKPHFPQVKLCFFCCKSRPIQPHLKGKGNHVVIDAHPIQSLNFSEATNSGVSLSGIFLAQKWCSSSTFLGETHSFLHRMNVSHVGGQSSEKLTTDHQFSQRGNSHKKYIQPQHSLSD